MKFVYNEMRIIYLHNARKLGYVFLEKEFLLIFPNLSILYEAISKRFRE